MFRFILSAIMASHFVGCGGSSAPSVAAPSVSALITTTGLSSLVTIGYPSTLTSSTDAETSSMLFRPAAFPAATVGTDVNVGITISIDPNPDRLEMTAFYNGDVGDDLGTPTGVITVGNSSGYRFLPSATQGGDVVVIVPRADGTFLRIVDQGAAFQDNGVFVEMLRSIKISN